jgi:hypothetical protein
MNISNYNNYSLYLYQFKILQRWSNTDSGTKRRVYCRYIAILYLAFNIRNLFYFKMVSFIPLEISIKIKD